MLDGLNRVPDLMQKVVNNGMSSVAMTDHGVMYGSTEFWLGAKDHGIKPILGCELYLSPERMDLRREVNGIRYYHLLALAMNKTGYKNLNRLVSLASTKGVYYKPRVDKETLAQHSEGLVITSACLAGPLARHITRGEDQKAHEWLDFFRTEFKDRFYLEVQRNGFAKTDDWRDEFAKGLNADEIEGIKLQMQVNTRLKEYADKYKLPLITTTDAHYLDKEDKDTQEILFAIKDGKLLDDPERRLGYLDTYVKTPEEMGEIFSDTPEILENTLALADSIEPYDLDFDRVQPQYIPQSKVEAKKSAQENLRDQVLAGAKQMYGKVSAELLERIDYELDVIHQKGYDDYFLVVSDIIKWARGQEIVVGVRGSVAGSVVAYCLDIINVEPIGWELYFERFLNPERPSPPDIDVDFQDDRRDEVVEYVAKKYGNENVAAICAIGRMKTKAAIRDVARVMNIDLKIADQLSKMVHVIFGKVKPINKMMADDPEFAGIINSDPQLQKLKQAVEKIEGMARHVSTHACGYLITPDPITDYVSVQYESGKNEGKIITQQEGVWIEALGLMKFDFLGLRNLTIIKNTLDLIEKYHGKRFTTKEIPLDDRPTFELFGRGETIGVFQFESPPMQKYLRDLQPETLEDLCFMVSAYRPGPMKYIPDYIDCRHGRKEPEFLIPEMKPILNKTFGFAIYQEQVIKIAVDIAGYSMGGADLLRRAMGKKKVAIMKKEEPIFKKGVMKRGYDEKIAQKIWEYLLPFADYGFNKAHGASYALVAYWCAYLKANYPIEFMTGLMHSDVGDSDRIAIDMAEARRMGFTILPPDVNKSEVYFTIEGKEYIRFGLGAVKNVGRKLVEKVVAERQEHGDYKSFLDFVNRTVGFKYTKKALECLIKIGAFDRFAQRNQLLLAAEMALEQANQLHKIKATGQTDMFGQAILGANEVTADGGAEIQTEEIQLQNLPDVDDTQKITWEKELLSSYITAHPLDKYKLVALNGNITTPTAMAEWNRPKLGEKIRVLALMAGVKNVLTKSGNKPMAILTLEDQLNKLDAVVFPRQYENLRASILEGTAAVLVGQLSERDESHNLIVEDILPADSFHNASEISIDIRRATDKQELTELKKSISSARGQDVALKIFYGSTHSPKTITTTVAAQPDLIEKLQKFIVRKAS